MSIPEPVDTFDSLARDIERWSIRDGSACMDVFANRLRALAASLSSRALAAEEERERLEGEWAIMARACGNWREWPASLARVTAPDHTDPDWQAAARAILERDAILADAGRLREEIELMLGNWTNVKARDRLDAAARTHPAGAGPTPLTPES